MAPVGTVGGGGGGAAADPNIMIRSTMISSSNPPPPHQPSSKGEMHIQDLIPTSMRFEDEIQRTVSSPTPPH